AHGVSTRKRKKRNYSFLDDEVRIQKYGLLSHFSNHLFHSNLVLFDRIKMDSLLARIPELNGSFQMVKGWKPLMPLNVTQNTITIPRSILDHLHMTEQRFIQFMENQCEFYPFSCQRRKEEISFVCQK